MEGGEEGDGGEGKTNSETEYHASFSSDVKSL